jgi:hypothetical protein
LNIFKVIYNIRYFIVHILKSPAKNPVFSGRKQDFETGYQRMINTLPFNPLNAELNPICHLLALVGAHHIFHVSGLRVKRLILPTPNHVETKISFIYLGNKKLSAF